MSSNPVIPVLPLRDVVVYPSMVIPLFVGRERSIRALEAATQESKELLLVAQRDPAVDDPGADDVFDHGTLATILQLIKLPDGTIKVLVEGERRARLVRLEADAEFLQGAVEQLSGDQPEANEAETLARLLMDQFEGYAQANKKVPSELLNSLQGIDELGRLTDTMAAHLPLTLAQKQSLLECVDVSDRAERLIAMMEAELELQQVEKRIRGRVKQQMEKSQREYYLNEQMKAIQKEIGDLEDVPNELEQLEEKIDAAKMPAEARSKAQAELNKLRMMSPMSAEASVVRAYLDWLLGVPWSKRSRVRTDLAHAQQVLDQDHYGLAEVKERILEYLAVQKRVRSLKGPVLCLVGPPGVGKTSLGESLARATNRKFVRMALGGVRDEAEIRGHRRTYIGSMPGKVVQKMSKVGVKNPLFLLDEIDKMGMDHRGDPASALLEVLDPEQNHTFSDHYLELDYDLSEVMFVCTANSMNLPEPLLDRMEVIRIPGYTEDEKLAIAERYLVPKQVKNNGLRSEELSLGADPLLEIIRYYTREAGVRGLERQIAKVCRKRVKELLLDQPMEGPEQAPSIERYLGVRKFKYGRAEECDQVGQVAGLAWTQVGGELLTIEAAAVPGKGRQVRTGSLGDVMQESIQAALTVVRSRAEALGIDRDFHQQYDIHIHVPEGATPKDGPSAGIGMCTALVSVLTGIPVRADVAMTGEITLRGQVLQIGGLKEKLLAARRAGIRTVVIPRENERDLGEIPDTITSKLDIRPVDWIDEVLDVALADKPQPLQTAGDDAQSTLAEKTGTAKKPRKSDKKHLSTH